MTHVSLKDLTKIYQGAATPAVAGLTVDMASGSLTAVLGPSGCGKTTALKMIAGLVEPTRGDVTFDGRSVMQDPPEHRGAVMVFQNALLFPHMTVAENVAFGLRMRKIPRALMTAKVADMLALVRLPDFGPRRPTELSGGQQQRVALARALIIRPKVLLLDEPLSNLDAHLRLEMRDLILDLQRHLRITTIFVTHDQQEAVVLADRIALILDGQLRQFAEPDQFYIRPETEAVARFFGGQNFLPGQSDGKLFHSALGTFTLPDGARVGPGKLTIRPEVIRLGQGRENTVTATVAGRIYLGTEVRLDLRIGATDLVATVSPDQAQGVEIGQSLAITLAPHHLWVV